MKHISFNTRLVQLKQNRFINEKTTPTEELMQGSQIHLKRLHILFNIKCHARLFFLSLSVYSFVFHCIQQQKFKGLHLVFASLESVCDPCNILLTTHDQDYLKILSQK